MRYRQPIRQQFLKYFFFPLLSSRGYDGGVSDFGHTNPLAHLSESVNNIDPLNAMEKSLNEVR